MVHLRAAVAAFVLTSCMPNEEIMAYASGLVITSGGTYSGHWESLDESVPAVRIRTEEPVIIENATIRGRGDLIRTDAGHDVDVTIRNVVGEGLPPTGAGRYPGRFLNADAFRRVTVENSTLIGTSGIYLAHGVEGATVRILRNRATNLDGRRSDGAGGYDGFYRVQFVQLNQARELRDSEIAWNEVVNEPYRSRVEDVISLFRTTGRPDDPVRVHDNFIRGAYPADPAADGFSGGGIMLGDGSGAHLLAYDNQVVATSNYGIAVSGGRDIHVMDNRVVSCGRLDDGTLVASQNVGIYLWNFARDRDWGHVEGSGNVIAWNHPGRGRNDAWVPDATHWDPGERSFPSGPIACDVEDGEYDLWQRKVADVGLTLGASDVVEAP